MNKSLLLVFLTLTLAIACLAQEGMVTVTSRERQRSPKKEEVNKIYLSACSAVQREFANSNAIRPPITLVLGADKNAVDFDKRTVLLIKWDRDLFAQGVVILAFEDLLSPQRRMMVAKRAVSWADATVEVSEIAK